MFEFLKKIISIQGLIFLFFIDPLGQLTIKQAMELAE